MKATTERGLLCIENGIVLTMEPSRPVLPRGVVVVEGNRLLEVSGDPGTAQAYPDAQRIDAGGCVVLPGLINAHAHLRPMRGIGEGMDVAAWHSQYVDGISELMTPEDAYYGAACAYLEMIRNGITTVLAMSILEPDDLRAALDTGIRARIARHSERPPELAETMARVREQGGSEQDRARLWLGMEWTSTWSAAQLAAVRETMEQAGVRVHAHFSEIRSDPLDNLAEAGLLRAGLILAHCVHVNPQTSRRMADAGVAVVHNPRSNMKFASGAAPIPRYLQEGIPVGLGTDGPLSTFAMDLFEEMRAAVMLARVWTGDPKALPVEQALSMATRMNAEILGLPDQIGTLAPGKKADVAIIDLNGPQFRPLLVDGPVPNLLSLLVFTAVGRDVRDVIIDGRLVMRNREVLTVDEEKIKAECQQRGTRLLGELTGR